MICETPERERDRDEIQDFWSCGHCVVLDLRVIGSHVYDFPFLWLSNVSLTGFALHPSVT